MTLFKHTCDTPIDQAQCSKSVDLLALKAIPDLAGFGLFVLSPESSQVVGVESQCAPAAFQVVARRYA